MRYIDTTNLYSKSGKWNLTPSESKPVWNKYPLKTNFKEHFYNKCWYTETKIVGSDAHIDHFYPKGGNKRYKSYHYNNKDAVKGYTWLKDEYKNYHVACAYANRGKDKGGKKDYFPLCAGSPLLTHGDKNLSLEKPMLLNPTSQKDVKLLVFVENGNVECSSSDPLDMDRVEVSKHLYNLTHQDFVAERTRIWNSTKEYIDLFKNGGINAKECIRQLKQYIAKDAPFSAVAISCIRNYLIDTNPNEANILNQLDLNL